MDRKEIVAMAREAGMEIHILDDEYCDSCNMPRGSVVAIYDIRFSELVYFAALVAAKEREACAQLCDSMQLRYPHTAEPIECAEAIRARSSHNGNMYSESTDESH